jgi:hypothetical protein
MFSFNRKLKRDSGQAMEGVITETDRLLLQKDEEVKVTINYFDHYVYNIWSGRNT